MLEFSKYGYKKTSVEDIAKSSEISKSMIFHYFSSKLNLYNYLVVESSNYIIEKYSNLQEDIKNLDFISRYKFVAKTKFESMLESDALFRFSAYLFLNKEDIDFSSQAQKSLARLNELYVSFSSLLSSNIDYSLIRDDIDKKSCIRYMTWIMDGFSHDLAKKLAHKPLAKMSFNQDWKDFDIMVDDLKKIFYKEEYHER